MSGLLATLVSVFIPAHTSPGSFFTALRPTLFLLAWTAPTYLVLDRRRRDPLVALGLLVRPRGLLLAALPYLLLPVYGIVWGIAWGRQVPHLDLQIMGVAFVNALLFAALPEETFFRGALQPSILTTRPWLAIVATSALFALAHLAFDRRPERLLVFFPSLVFGWMRLRTGSVVPGVVFHAACNALEAGLRQ